MSTNIKFLYLFLLGAVFTVLPVLFFITGDFVRRDILKDSISIVTILSFFIILGQFYLSKINEGIIKLFKTFKVIKVHKVIGYIFLPILIVHPILIVVPRFFEAGADPVESLITMITTFDNLGIVFGIIAWILMFALGLTSLFRNKLNMSYKNWKLLHGVLSLAFIVLAAWHVVDLGRHMDNSMISLIIIVTALASILLLKTYISPKKRGQIKKETTNA